MNEREVMDEFRALLTKTLTERTPINIKLYFNSDGELQISHRVENTSFLTTIGNSEDSPLAPYLETFASSFTKLKRKEKKNESDC